MPDQKRMIATLLRGAGDETKSPGYRAWLAERAASWLREDSEIDQRYPDPRRALGPCAQIESGGPCLVNTTVPRSRWCTSCRAAEAILTGNFAEVLER